VTEGSNADATVGHIEKERISTEKALQFCTVLSDQIEQIQADFQSSRDPDSTSGMLFGEGLEGCKHHIRFTLANLEKHQKSVSERLSTSSDAPSAEDKVAFDKLQKEVQTLRRSLEFLSDVDAYMEIKISNIENHAEGDDTIQLMVSTDGRPLIGKNRGVGKRQKQAGGHFGDASLQQVSGDFKSIALHQGGHAENDAKFIEPVPGDDASPNPKPPFGGRHGPGFVLAKSPGPKKQHQEQ
jgi:hypothetical protein